MGRNFVTVWTDPDDWSHIVRRYRDGLLLEVKRPGSTWIDGDRLTRLMGLIPANERTVGTSASPEAKALR